MFSDRLVWSVNFSMSHSIRVIWQTEMQLVLLSMVHIMVYCLHEISIHLVCLEEIIFQSRLFRWNKTRDHLYTDTHPRQTHTSTRIHTHAHPRRICKVPNFQTLSLTSSLFVNVLPAPIIMQYRWQAACYPWYSVSMSCCQYGYGCICTAKYIKFLSESVHFYRRPWYHLVYGDENSN